MKVSSVVLSVVAVVMLSGPARADLNANDRALLGLAQQAGMTFFQAISAHNENLIKQAMLSYDEARSFFVNVTPQSYQAYVNNVWNDCRNLLNAADNVRRNYGTVSLLGVEVEGWDSRAVGGYARPVPRVKVRPVFNINGRRVPGADYIVLLRVNNYWRLGQMYDR